jgi:hypothetical protein
MPYSMDNRSNPTFRDRLSHSSDAKSAMLAKFKRAQDPDNPEAVEKRRQREAVVEARAERAAQREAALKAEQKAARDARYAARKAAKKERRRGY